MIEGFADRSEEKKKVAKATWFIKNLQPISVGV